MEGRGREVKTRKGRRATFELIYTLRGVGREGRWDGRSRMSPGIAGETVVVDGVDLKNGVEG